MTFRDLNLNSSILNALDELGYETPTTIQERAFSPILSGRDVMGVAQTGTGKTLGYVLPLLKLWKFQKDRFPRILVIVPTRELVMQVVDVVKSLTTYMNFEVAGAYGGTNMKTQIRVLDNGLDMLVGTPGRVNDLALYGSLKLKHIKKLVIDEVDEMLNLGFRAQLNSIFDLLPKKRQNLLFSATMTTDVEKVIHEFFNSPIKIEAAPSGTPLENIDQAGYEVANYYTKVNLLEHLLQTDETMSKVLIFTATKKLADYLFNQIAEKFPEQIGVIHSNKSQNFRFNVVNSFHDGTYRIVIATDIVARGIDVSEVSHVINFDLPEVPENYMHRIGRTGRADKKGISISFITEKDVDFKAGIEELMAMKISMIEMPDEVEVEDRIAEHERPQIHMPNLVKPKISTGGAYHKKKDPLTKSKLSKAQKNRKRRAEERKKRK